MPHGTAKKKNYLWIVNCKVSDPPDQLNDPEFFINFFSNSITDVYGNCSHKGFLVFDC